MSPEISEQQLEDDIECALLAYGPDACAGDEPGVAEPVARYGDALPGGYHRRDWQADYDRHLCLIPRDVIDFMLATQPKEWEKLKQHHGAEVKEQFLARLARGDRAARRARRAAQRHQGLGLQVPAGVLPARQRAQRGAPAPATRRTCSPWCASSTTARRTRRASTSRSS